MVTNNQRDIEVKNSLLVNPYLTLAFMNIHDRLHPL